MAGISSRLESFLAESGVHYERVHHRPDYQAEQAALDTHTPAREFAKTVFVEVDGRFAMAVMAADQFLSERRMRESLGAGQIRLANEEEIERLCPDSDVGAAPPFGNLYGLDVYVSPTLARDEQITFNAGSHQEAMRMAYADFARLAKPRVVAMSRQDFLSEDEADEGRP